MEKNDSEMQPNDTEMQPQEETQRSLRKRKQPADSAYSPPSPRPKPNKSQQQAARQKKHMEKIRNDPVRYSA